jgi:hypothetical protein
MAVAGTEFELWIKYFIISDPSDPFGPFDPPEQGISLFQMDSLNRISNWFFAWCKALVRGKWQSGSLNMP